MACFDRGLCLRNIVDADRDVPDSESVKTEVRKLETELCLRERA